MRITPLEVPELVRFELRDGVNLVWRPVIGALESAVAIIDHAEHKVLASVFVTETEARLPPIAAASYSVVIRAYDFRFGDAEAASWPDNPRMSELQFQGPLLPPG